jgi:tryptophan-rich sensory protein
MLLFFGQLALNFLWTAIFFGLQAPALALIEILIL